MPIITIKNNDPRYPTQLKELYDPPKSLFLRYEGSEPDFQNLFKKPLIAIVGARKMSSYGQRTIKTLVSSLCHAQAVIVSGLALGCDGEAHTQTLNSNGQTLAIIGSGLDDASIYPATNQALARRMLSSGQILMSEYAPGVRARSFHFPVRNRIIAALSQAVVVIEAQIKSGSLITAKTAADLGRDVFAIPGNIDQLMSTGTNWLIKNGAHVATEAKDILEVMGLETPPEQIKSIPILLRQIFDALEVPSAIDELTERLKLPAHKIMADLLQLELEGVVESHTGVWRKTLS